MISKFESRQNACNERKLEFRACLANLSFAFFDFEHVESEKNEIVCEN